MIENFLNWTRENEESIESSFIWKDLEVGQLVIHDTGILEYLPKIKTNKQIVLSCAIHGNETAPIEILNKLISDIKEKKLECIHNILFIFGNPKAINIEKRFYSENLNRLFADGLKGKQDNYETKRAKMLINALDQFYIKSSDKYHYDLHTAIRDSKISKFAISPFAPDRNINLNQLGFLKNMSVEAVILGNSPATTFSYHSSSIYNANSFTLELGKVKRFGENDSRNFIKVEETLRQLVSNTYTETNDYDGLKVFRIKDEVIKTDESFDFPFDDKTANFTQFKNGEILYTENSEEYLSEDDDSYILFPNKKVKQNERAALIITSKGLPI